MEYELFGIGFWIGCFLAFAIYSYMALNATTCVEYAGAASISFFNAPVVLRENLGLLLRIVRGKRGYSPHMNPYRVFRVDPGCCDVVEATAACTAKLAVLSRQSWTYPASQLVCIRRLAAQLLKEVKESDAMCNRDGFMKDAYENRFEELQRKARQARQEQSRQEPFTRPTPAPRGWRTVLGVSYQERDASNVKRAYRKLAFQFHPDLGGDDVMMAQLNEALAQARKELSFV